MNPVNVPQSKIHVQGMTDPGRGEHLWVYLAMFKMADATLKASLEGRVPGPEILDHENLLSVEGPGCFKCEEPFSPRLAHRKCTGTM